MLRHSKLFFSKISLLMIDFPSSVILGQIIASTLGSNIWSLIVCYVLESQESRLSKFLPFTP